MFSLTLGVQVAARLCTDWLGRSRWRLGLTSWEGKLVEARGTETESEAEGPAGRFLKPLVMGLDTALGL